MDALAECRRQHKLPALSIQWGPVADVGFVAEIMKASPFKPQGKGDKLPDKLAGMLQAIACCVPSPKVSATRATLPGQLEFNCGS